MKEAVLNLDHVPNWDNELSDAYIKECRIFYQSKCNSSFCFGYQRPDLVTINKLYKEGRDLKVLNCDYVHFVDCVTGNYYKKYPYYGYLKTEYRHRHEEHVDWKSKGKKTLSTERQAKKDWREHRCLDKDKSKHGWRRRRGCPKWIKRYSNKLHRQWEREKINREEWDDMCDMDYKFFLDPWLWD